MLKFSSKPDQKKLPDETTPIIDTDFSATSAAHGQMPTPLEQVPFLPVVETHDIQLEIGMITAEENLTSYPQFIEQTTEYAENFQKQFGDVISKKLKRKLQSPPHFNELK